jgi:hypothetical protein
LLQAQVASKRKFLSIVPPVRKPSLGDVSFAAQFPVWVVLPSTIRLACQQMVLPAWGPVAVATGWLNVIVSSSPASMRPLPVFVNETMLATKPSRAPATGLFWTLVHEW